MAVPRERVAYVIGELKSRRTEVNCTTKLRIELVSAPPSLPSSAVETISSDTESALVAIIASVTSIFTVSALEGSMVGREEGSGDGKGVGVSVGESTGE